MIVDKLTNIPTIIIYNSHIKRGEKDFHAIRSSIQHAQQLPSKEWNGMERKN